MTDPVPGAAGEGETMRGEDADMDRLRATGVQQVIADINEWLGNSDGLMVEDVVEWRDKLVAALAAAPPPVPPEKATEIAWPQEAVDLIEMAEDWPLPTDDSGAMFSGDVLIHKLGNALRAALAAPPPVPEPPA